MCGGGIDGSAIIVRDSIALTPFPSPYSLSLSPRPLFIVPLADRDGCDFNERSEKAKKFHSGGDQSAIEFDRSDGNNNSTKEAKGRLERHFGIRR